VTRERHERARELFQRASGLPEADHDAFLRGASGDDMDLLEEVRGLLAFDASPEGAVPDTVIRHAETYNEPSSELIQRLVEHRPGRSR